MPGLPGTVDLGSPGWPGGAAPIFKLGALSPPGGGIGLEFDQYAAEGMLQVVKSLFIF